MGYDTLHDHCYIDDKLWEDLKNSDIETVCRNSGTSFDTEGNFYRIPVLDTEFAVFPEKKKIEELPGFKAINDNEVEIYLYLLHYLLGAKDIPLAGKPVADKEIKGGEMFFRGLHALPTEDIINKFGRDTTGFIQAGKRLGGRVSEFGDASIELMAAPKLPVIYVLWAADDEFPASVTYLFDQTIGQFLPLDVIYGMCIYVHQRIVNI